jgi:hypothetical protein
VIYLGRLRLTSQHVVRALSRINDTTVCAGVGVCAGVDSNYVSLNIISCI